MHMRPHITINLNGPEYRSFCVSFCVNGNLSSKWKHVSASFIDARDPLTSLMTIPLAALWLLEVNLTWKRRRTTRPVSAQSTGTIRKRGVHLRGV